MPVEGLWAGNATSRDRGRRERTRRGDDCFHQREAIKTSRSTPRSRASMLLLASASADPLEAGGPTRMAINTGRKFPQCPERPVPVTAASTVALGRSTTLHAEAINTARRIPGAGASGPATAVGASAPVGEGGSPLQDAIDTGRRHPQGLPEVRVLIAVGVGGPVWRAGVRRRRRSAPPQGPGQGRAGEGCARLGDASVYERCPLSARTGGQPGTRSNKSVRQSGPAAHFDQVLVVPERLLKVRDCLSANDASDQPANDGVCLGAAGG